MTNHGKVRSLFGGGGGYVISVLRSKKFLKIISVCQFVMWRALQPKCMDRCIK